MVFIILPVAFTFNIGVLEQLPVYKLGVCNLTFHFKDRKTQLELLVLSHCDWINFLFCHMSCHMSSPSDRRLCRRYFLVSGYGNGCCGIEIRWGPEEHSWKIFTKQVVCGWQIRGHMKVILSQPWELMRLLSADLLGDIEISQRIWINSIFPHLTLSLFLGIILTCLFSVIFISNKSPYNVF